jgi:hypothetical protein
MYPEYDEVEEAFFGDIKEEKLTKSSIEKEDDIPFNLSKKEGVRKPPKEEVVEEELVEEEVSEDEDTSDEENDVYKTRYQTYPSGSVKPMINMEDVEEFLKGGAGVNRGYVNDDGAYNEETVLKNQYKETLPNVHPRNEIAPMVKKINPFKSLEANFREVSPLDMYTRNNLANQEAAGVEDLYPGQNEIGRFSPSPFSV